MAEDKATTYLTIDQIIQAPDLHEEDIHVPEWQGNVRIRAFSKAQQQQIRDQSRLRANTQTQKAGEIDTGRLEMLMLVQGVVEPKPEQGHIPALRQKSAGAIERILARLMAISGMTEGTVEKAEAQFPD